MRLDTLFRAGVALTFAIAIASSMSRAIGTPPVRFDPMSLVGPGVTTLAVGDFDQDGRLDVVSGDDYSGMGTLYFGNGYGSLVESIAVNVGRPNALLMVDVDNDSFPEIIVATDLRILVIQNDGGAIGTVQHHLVGQNPVDLAAVDLDQNGFLDLVSADQDSDTTSVLLNDGTGSFASAVAYPTGPGPSDVSFGDFNGDQLADICVVHSGSGDVEVFYGNGLGGLADAGTHATASGAVDVRAADFNGDLFDDIVVGHGSLFTVLVNDQSGSFASSSRTVGASVRALAEGDVNGDDLIDLVVHGASGAIVYLGDGQGGFDPPLAAGAYGISSQQVELADMRGDGNLDLVIAFNQRVQYGIGIAPGSGTGAFGGDTAMSALGALQGAAVGDFNSDGAQDLALASELGVRLLLANGSGGYASPVTLVGLLQVDAVVAADFDGDGNVDLAATSGTNGEVAAFLGDGTGGFTQSMLFTDIVLPRGLAAVSVNDLEDSHVDLLVADQGATAIVTLLGDGAGGFSRENASSGGWEPITVSTGDFDGDGHVDMAIGREYADFIVGGLVRFGNGRGEFPREQWFHDTKSPNSVVCTDLDDDGFDDVVFLENAFGQIYAYLSDGQGGFGSPEVFDPPFLTGYLSTNDVNSDGRADLVGVAYTGSFLVWLGRGDGSFEDSTAWATRTQATFGLVARLDADAMPDLLVVTELGVATIHRNRTLDPLGCRAGSVGVAQASVPESVLFVNGSAGAGGAGRVETGITDSFEIYMEAPSCAGGGPAPYVLYVWVFEPNEESVRPMPFDLGLICKPAFLTDPEPAKLKKVWNNIGKTDSLGESSFPSTPAPGLVIDRPNGVGFPVEAFLQGIILDPCAANGIASTTNGVLVIVE